MMQNDDITCKNDKKLCKTDTCIGFCIDMELEHGCDGDDPNYNLQIELGREKGYIDDYLLDDCGWGEIVQTYHFDCSDKVPKNFSIGTLNVMGIYRGNESVLKLMELRAEILTNQIIELALDIFCFQEMSSEFFDYLYTDHIKKLYPYHTPIGSLDKKKLKRIKKDIEAFVISKYKPTKIEIIALGGNLGYTNSLQIVEYDNLIIFDAYLQAGSKASPGQKYKSMHYSRCRGQQLKYIKNLIQPYLHQKATILLGDFNFDLNGTEIDWPEKIMIDQLGLTDSWPEANPNSNVETGATENTIKNTMRYNSKFEDKMYRYDAILFNKNNLRIISSKIICDQPLRLIEKYANYNQYYEQAIIPTNCLDNKKLKKYDHNGKNAYDLFISDHFGVQSTFQIL